MNFDFVRGVPGFSQLFEACDAAELPCLLIEVDRQMTNYEQARTMLEGFKDMLA